MTVFSPIRGSLILSSALAVLLSQRVQAQAQDLPPDDPHQKHVLGIIPNFRTSPLLAEYKPISVKEKFSIARQDSFDRGTVALAAIFAGFSQLNNSNPSFGQGVAGYSRRLGAAYGDFVIGNYMTEGIYPSILHQDPRYFRRGTGTGMSRFFYSAGQIFITHGDSGKTQFNYSEVLGNSTAVAVGLSYYRDSRTAHDAITQLASQLLVDAASNVAKEFWPDVDRRVHHRSKSKASSNVQ